MFVKSDRHRRADTIIVVPLATAMFDECKDPHGSSPRTSSDSRYPTPDPKSSSASPNQHYDQETEIWAAMVLMRMSQDPTSNLYLCDDDNGIATTTL